MAAGVAGTVAGSGGTGDRERLVTITSNLLQYWHRHGERGGMTSKSTVKNQILRQSQWLAAAVVVVSLVMGVLQYDQPVFWAWVVIASLAGGHERDRPEQSQPVPG